MKSSMALIISFLVLTSWGCRSQLTDPTPRDEGGQSTPGEGGDGQGSGGPIGLPITAPNIELLSLMGGDAIQGGAVEGYPIRIKTTSSVGVSANRIEFSRDGGNTWELAVSSAGQNAAIFPSLDAQVTIFNWLVPAEVNCDGAQPTKDGTTYRIRVTTRSRPYEPQQVVGSVSDFTVDSCAPSLSQNNLTTDPDTNRAGFLGINLSHIEDMWRLGFVSAVCLKIEATPPLKDDVCWTPVTGFANPVLVENFAMRYFWGFTPISSLSLYFWTKDSAGNISVNNEEEGKDYIATYSRDCSGAACQAVSISSDPLQPRNDVSSEIVQKSFGITDANQFWLDQQSFAVTSKGKLFYLKGFEGLFIKDIVDNSTVTRIPEFCGMEKDGNLAHYTDEDPTSFAGAILCNPTRIALDAQENLLIFDGFYIRKIFTNEVPMRLETIVGGRAAVDGQITKGTLLDLSINDPKDLLIDRDSPANPNIQYFGTFEVLPNGWIVFNDQDPFVPVTGTNSYRLRIYKPERATDKIQTLTFEGTGVLGNDSQVLTAMNVMAPALIHYNVQLKNIERVTLRLCDLGGGATCTLQTATFNEFGKPVGQAQQFPWINVVGMTRLFQVNPGSYLGISAYEGKVYQYQTSQSGWMEIAGSTARRGGSACAEATGSLSCSLNLIDAAMGPGNIIFLIDGDRIRFIEKLTSEMKTLVTPEVLGPPPLGP